DLLEPQDVPVRRAYLAVERAEVALGHADVGVVDVAVDDVGDDALGMFAGTDSIGESSEQARRRVHVQVERLLTIEPAAGLYLRLEFRDRHALCLLIRKTRAGD